jgi:Carboxypeptidase regulatory-like domain/TonB-dependent Receptor Plug Domain/TonB dependent receptor
MRLAEERRRIRRNTVPANRRDWLGTLLRLAIPALWVSLILAPGQATAQVSGGTVSGSVTDASGAAVPNAQVSMSNASTGGTRSVATDTQGLYAIPNLPPETYEMTASARGFTTQVRTGITVTMGAQLVLNVAMKAGSPTEVVRMEADATQASQASSAVSGNVSSSTVRNVPLNGRDWTQLATLQAGVTGIQTGSAQGGGNTDRGFGAAISVSGARPDQNNFRLDGISINDYSNGAPGSVLGDNLGVDAVEQVSVLGSNYPAEYGRTSGGVINAVTRAGTNTFHGSVYEFLRNSALDARNFFDGEIPPFKRNQFGASGGGPIQKDRTFVFADYEGLRQSLGVTQVDTVPSAAARSGQLSTGPVTVDPAVARFLQAFYPLPNGSLLGKGDTGIFTFAGQQVTNENYFTTRIDRKFSEKDSLSGTYMRDNSKTVQPDAFDELISNIVSRRQLVTLHWQHILSPGFLNVARFGFNRSVGIEGGVTKVINPFLADAAFGFIPGQFVGSIKSVAGVTNFNGGPYAKIPGTFNTGKSLFWNSFQWGDDLFVTKGVHALQFGMTVERMQDNQLQVSNGNGGFRFGSLSDFLTNRPRNFQGLRPLPISEIGTRQTLLGAYGQDDIRVRPNLTLNVGLRYEMATVPTEAHNRISNLRNLTDAQPHLGSPYFLNPTLRNFEPRLGFAWDPLGNGKTLLRGGFGVFDVLPLPYEFSLTTAQAAPFAQQVFVVSIPPGSFPTGAFQQFGGSSNANKGGFIEHDPKRNYVMQWNVNVARELSSNLIATVSYVGSRGIHQPYRVDNFDMVLPTSTPAGYLFPPLATSQILNPNYGRISGTLWQANSFYNALELDMTRRVSHGIEIHGAYTWSKSLDTLSATVADDAFPNGLFNQLFFDQRTTRGLSDFNVGQTLVVNFTWEVPTPGTRSRLMGRFLGGWQLGGVYKASSGQPFTPLLGGDPLGTKLDEDSEPPNRLVGPGCDTLMNVGNPNHYIKTQCLGFPNPSNLRGNLGRNTLIGPGISKFDFSVFKNNRVRRVSENFNVQFRAEFFNVFNRANFASPTDNLNVFDPNGNPIPSAGLITGTQTPSREIQLALKVIW